MRLRSLFALLLIVSGCSGAETIKTVRGPNGITAEIKEIRHGASSSNDIEITLVSSDKKTRVIILKGSGGSRGGVVFQDKNKVLVQYCSPLKYESMGYIYNLGDDYRFSDVRIAVLTVESRVGTAIFCRERGRATIS